jgi:chromosome segregation ATPase
MAEKLTDKEINAIISMTEKLNQRNKEVEQLTQHNLNLHGQLDGTQAVKEFLVSKVRTMEQTLTKSTDVERKTTQQIASDQEVIAFLDSRVRELENQERLWVAEKKSLSDQLIHVQVQTEQKITVLSDMLQYERERGAENERDWKTTRKVLVKEVKSCRTQIWTLQAETMGLQEQNDRLKRAVLASGAAVHNGGSPMRDER